MQPSVQCCNQLGGSGRLPGDHGRGNTSSRGDAGQGYMGVAENSVGRVGRWGDIPNCRGRGGVNARTYRAN